MHIHSIHDAHLYRIQLTEVSHMYTEGHTSEYVNTIWDAHLYHIQYTDLPHAIAEGHALIYGSTIRDVQTYPIQCADVHYTIAEGPAFNVRKHHSGYADIPYTMRGCTLSDCGWTCGRMPVFSLL